MRMTQKITAFLLIAAASLSSLWAQPQTETRVQAQPETLTVVDDLGRSVTVSSPVSSVVPSGPLTEYALRPLAGEAMTGRSVKNWSDEARKFFPASYFDLPDIGQLYGGKGTLNPENIIALGPDVVIDIGEQKKNMTDDLDKLQDQLGIPFVHFDATVDTMGSAYEKIGKLIGKEEKAASLKAFIDKVTQQTASVTKEGKVKGIYVLGQKGVNVLARGSFQAGSVDKIIDNIAVVENPTSRGTGNEVDMEQILSWNPDYVLFAHDAKDVYEKAKDDPLWSQVKAIQDGHYYLIPDTPLNWLASPASVNQYLGQIWVPTLLYPEKTTWDAYEEVKEFFSLFCDYDMSREEFDALTAQ